MAKEKSKRGGLHIENPGGRPPKALTDRKAWKDKIAIRISVKAAVQLQQLMLRQVDGVKSPETMTEYLIRKELDMNEAAKKLVRRAARVAAHEMRDRARMGANIDTLIAEAWGHISNDEYRQWTGAREYFETIFINEVERGTEER